MTDAPDPLPLAAEFPSATREQWRKLVDSVLKGARFEDRLQSRTADGLIIEPLYPRASDVIPLPGRPNGRWQVMARIDHPDPDACNSEALHELDNGAEGLTLIPAGAVGAHGYGLAPTPTALTRALAGIHLDSGIAVELAFSPYAMEWPKTLCSVVEGRGLVPATVNIRFGLDPAGAFALHGKLPKVWPEIAAHMAATVADLAKRGFNGPFATADGRVVHNAGGTEAQEVAFALATAVVYLRTFEAGGIALDMARSTIQFQLTADADLFMTIAKFRAVRRLWTRIEESCGLTPAPVVVAGETSWCSMTRDDPYPNILRGTIAACAAGLGGADAIAVLPFSAARGLPDRFARRIARNTQFVLLDEANLARVADPTAGSGFVEDMTGRLCRAAWTLFQEIEAAGGAVAALERGLIQQKVKAARAARERALTDKRDALIGASEYAAAFDVPVLDVPRVTLAELPAAATCEPLAPVRFATPFEGR
jgi:methylmalonyl-CoA mutase